MKHQKKPMKKDDLELWSLIAEKIDALEYIFAKHAEDRQAERNIDDLTVINILENSGNARRNRNKSKDKYEPGHEDWNYCIEGYDHDNHKIRIVVSFDANNMLIITVIRI